ncbi:NfeD family protein [Stappia sp.]|jgi:membrane protein implicated in regulation of membrane protease activity|uniref:NfeD family protein n=1 Tax=Stappia sp. TaxID=1870903 RepID=UPI003A9973FA
MVLQRLVSELGPWLWWIIGLVLLGLEVLAPGTFFLWFGLSALVVGTLAIFVDVGWQAEVLLFAGLSLASLLAGRALLRRYPDEGGEPHLNRRGSRFVGQTYVLREPILDGSGRIAIDDTVWRVRGPDAPAGTRVRVLALDGSTLLIEHAD